MHFRVLFIILLTAVTQCIATGDNPENSAVDQPAPDESRFRKFLNLFGIGTNAIDREDYSRAYQQYGYPCAISTTTTPAPVMSPLLCPFPPMLPAQLNSPQKPPALSPLPPSSGLPLTLPPVAAIPPLLPPISGSESKPQFPLPGNIPQGAFPGYLPDRPHPPPHSFPGQTIPTPLPIQNLPQPIQPGNGGSNLPQFPAFPGPLHPSNINSEHGSGKPHDPTLLSSVVEHSQRPVTIDPINPENPVKVNPVGTNLLHPIKVTPVSQGFTKPIQINPVNFKPSNPIAIDPIKAGTPPFASPSNDQPFVVDPFIPILDNKGFSKNNPQPYFPSFGQMNVLINPGIPDKPLGKPLSATEIKPEVPLPVDQPASVSPLHNEGLPHNDYTIIGPIHGSLIPSQLGNNAVLIGPFIPNGVNQPHPPTTSNLALTGLPPPNMIKPLPPSFPNNGNKLVPMPFPHNETLFPPKGKQPFSPVSLPPPQPVQPKPQDTVSVPSCGTPYLRPYVPPGFHLSSINQFLGMPPPVNPKLLYPCPTLDLLKALDFKIMRSLILSSGLLPLFEHTRNYTLFVPSDAAFRRLPRWFRDSLEIDKKLKKALVLNHLIKEDLPLDILENEELILTARPGGHRIRVNIYQQENTYRTITVDGSEVEKGDVVTNNGRIHIVNKVLMPNLPRNAAQFLSEKLEFESFWNLVKQADLLDTFQSPTPFTLFIPVNEAVRKLSNSSFLADKEKLRNFVNYHVANGTYYSNGLVNNEFLLTNYEKEIKLQVVSDNFAKSLSSINGVVRILKSDITLTNGVAHIIDKCISEDAPFYVYPQSDEFKNEYGVMKRSFRVTSEEKDISSAF